MPNLLTKAKMLQALQIAPRQDNDYLRPHYPLPHTKEPSRASNRTYATIHLKSGGFSSPSSSRL